MPRSLAIAVTLRELGISLRDLEPAPDERRASLGESVQGLPARAYARRSRRASRLAVGEARQRPSPPTNAMRWSVRGFRPRPLDLRVNRAQDHPRRGARRALAAADIASEPTPYFAAGASRRGQARDPAPSAVPRPAPSRSRTRAVSCSVPDRRAQAQRDGRRLLRRRRRQDAVARRDHALPGAPLRVRRLCRTARQAQAAPRAIRTVERAAVPAQRRARHQGQASCRQDRPRSGRCAVQRLRHPASQSRPQVAPNAGSASTSLRPSRHASSKSAATLVKPGGRLVYTRPAACCREENEAIVDGFLGVASAIHAGRCRRRNLKRASVALDTGADAEALSASCNGCDGFFRGDPGSDAGPSVTLNAQGSTRVTCERHGHTSILSKIAAMLTPLDLDPHSAVARHPRRDPGTRRDRRLLPDRLGRRSSRASAAGANRVSPASAPAASTG